MTTRTASTVVLLAGALMAFYVLRSKPEGSRYKALWAVALMTLGLSVLADFAPDLAGPFAVLVMIAAYMRHKGTLGKVLPGQGTTG